MTCIPEEDAEQLLQNQWASMEKDKRALMSHIFVLREIVGQGEPICFWKYSRCSRLGEYGLVGSVRLKLKELF